MGCWPGVKVASLASCVFVLGGCEPQTDDHCPPGGYYVDNGVEREYSVCDSGGGIGDVSSACQGIEDSFGLVVELAEGAAEIIDVFATDGGAIVVTREGVTLFARSGERLARQRDLEIDTAAFDGMHLVVSTETMLISYDSSLREIARGTLTAQCSASVMISGNRFVCGGTEESNRTFYVYDALTGLLVLSTHTTFAEEGPMRRVTGRDAFVSVSGYFGTFLLFGVDAMGVVRATANSRSGDPSYRISPVYAFAQDPATHLITDQGVLLCLTPEDCNDPTLGLQPDGDIGPVSDQRYFSAMDVDVSGKLHAIAGPISSSSANHPTCEEGCAIERIDVGTRTVEASIPFQFEEGAAVMILRADPQGGLLLGCYDRVLLLPEAP